MPDPSTISAMPPVTTPNGTELVPVVIDGNKRMTTQQIAALLNGTSPTFLGLAVTGTSPVLLPHIHGDIAGSLYFHVKNVGATTLNKTAPVRLSGAVGDTTTLEIVAAEPGTTAIALLGATLAQNETGHAVVAGEITAVNTATLGASNTGVYVAAGGTLTGTRPASNVQRVATVGRSHASTGTLVVQIGQVAADLGITSTTFSGYRTGQWIYPVPATKGAGSSLAANTIYATPFEVKRTTRVDGMASRISTAAAGGNIQLAVYDTLNGVINNPIRNTVSLSTASATTVSDTSIASFLLSPGEVYWWCVNSDAAPVLESILNSNTHFSTLIGADLASVSNSSTASLIAYSYSQTFGTWPSLSAATATAVTANRNAMPLMRVSAFS